MGLKSAVLAPEEDYHSSVTYLKTATNEDSVYGRS